MGTTKLGIREARNIKNLFETVVVHPQGQLLLDMNNEGKPCRNRMKGSFLGCYRCEEGGDKPKGEGETEG